MIYTVTFNPALDYIVRVDHFKLGSVNRTVYEEILPGGKGINVSIVLKNMGHHSTALGFVAGFTGEKIEAELKKCGCSTDFIHLKKGMTRINVKLKSDEESEINGQGPLIPEEAVEALMGKIKCLGSEDILVLAGSIPDTLPEDMYERIMKQVSGKKLKIVVDATKDLLVNVLSYRPFLIKPNHHELGEIFGIELKTIDEIIEYAKKLQEMGARNVLVSMAGDGALFLSEQGDVLKSRAPEGEVVNSVGAGDSMVAGFLTGYIESNDYNKAFKMGIATGSASAFSDKLAVRSEAEQLYAALLNKEEEKR